MKPGWHFTTVWLLLLYAAAMGFGGSLVSIAESLSRNQPDSQMLPRVLLALASLLLSLGIVLKAKERK
jgi:hypothetical protein